MPTVNLRNPLGKTNGNGKRKVNSKTAMASAVFCNIPFVQKKDFQKGDICSKALLFLVLRM